MITSKKNFERPSLDRRHFLASAGMAAGSLLIVKPELVRGSAANSKIEVGFIGLGTRGSWIARHLKEHPGYQIVAVDDYFAQVSDETGAELGVAKERRYSGLSGYKRLLASKVDAVFCITPPYCFPDHVGAAVKAGCHVYMAKPVATDVPGTLKIAEAAKQATASQKVFLVDFQARTSPFFMEAISRVHRGDIGSLGMVIVRCASDNWTDAPKTKTIADRLHDLIWVHDTELGGGYICNYDIHAMDVALWMARATPVSAMGYSQKLDPTLSGDSPEIYSLSYQFEKELILSHHGEHLRNTNPWLLRVDGCGDKGYMESDYYTKVWIHSNKQSYRGGEVPNLYKEGMQANVDTFYRSVIEGSHTNPTVQPALDANFATILGREASSRNGLLTMKDLLRENKKLEVDYHGLID